MFIIWGRKIVRRKLGFVADFCPICRAVTAHRLGRIGSAGHVYYLSFGEGRLVGHERTCQHCKTTSITEESRYGTPEKKLAAVEMLVIKTFPTIRAHYADRLELENRIKLGPTHVTAEERSALIASPFLVLSQMVEERFARTQIDRYGALAIVGMVVLLLATSGIANRLAPDQLPEMVLTALVVGLALVVWQIAAGSKRYMSEEIVPRLATALRPLRPSPDEIRGVLADLTAHKHKLGKKVDPTLLAAAI
jgi:hypothetical protein